MKDQVLDAKLKNLIQVCKETQNYKKLAVVSFILTSNKINELGINLGVRPRDQFSGEKLFEYMALINEVFEDNLKISIFKTTMIEMVQEIEILFLRSKGDIPLEYTKKMYEIYYDLRDLEVPNLHKSSNQDSIFQSSKLGIFSVLSSGNRRKGKDTDVLKPLILQRIKEREISLQRRLSKRLDSHQFETAIYLKSIKNSITSDKKGKITIYGALKDNINYQNSIESIFGYFILGLIILMASLGIIILTELSFTHLFSNDLSSWILIFFGSAAILIYFYIKQFRRQRG